MNRSIQTQCLSEENNKQIQEVKELREELKRENHHELQCSSIPEIFSDSHGLHIDPCYKKYLSLKCKISAVWLVETACIFLIFLIATVQISIECETQENEPGYTKHLKLYYP